MKNKRLKPLATFACAALACVGLNMVSYSIANAIEVKLDTGETIDLDSGVVNVCKSEGLNLGACACVVSIMLEQEGLSVMSLAAMTRLADAYPNEYREARAHCISVN
ncbi:hypothetical protein [Roseibium sp. Sym1]|uniref:hypothetical protein n=1 Tax=Roseibium sp. Sym1 TaxID=3016006 RepID=UPI0022B39929|nr:hypothetical protein [Roseibium sp. Sym1]